MFSFKRFVPSKVNNNGKQYIVRNSTEILNYESYILAEHKDNHLLLFIPNSGQLSELSSTET